MKSFPNPATTNRRSLGGGARRARSVAVGALAVLALSACSGGTGDQGDATSTRAPLDTAGSSTSSPSTSAPSSTPTSASRAAGSTAVNATPSTEASTEPSPAPTTVDAPPAAAGWVRHPSGDDCACSDGSEHAIHTRAGDPTKVLLYFQGGGACVDAATCGPDGLTYKTTTWPTDHPDENPAGIFAVDEPRNPFNGWTHAFVPYCSADFFLGDAITTYAPDVRIEHRGSNTSRHAVDLVAERYGDVEQLVVAGSSAGAVPTPLVAGLASDLLPDADIAVIADGAGGYPSERELNEFLADVWGTEASMPSWPELARVGVGEWGIPDLFAYAGRHDPSIRMARFDDVHDGVQVYYAGLLVGAAAESAGGAGYFDGDLPASLGHNERRIESAGVALDVYLSPTDDHTVLMQPRLYELEIDGVALVDWIAGIAAGAAPGDVRCPTCPG